ncbi:hydroxyacylglutathione hydrolase [Actinoplanes ianthinogenes]|uniref:Hydroxyacylglutathione hydrolase n=1 Tax=Actinoplanes ianthinogenes TaxID=122358 RepID=A0ABM7LLE7_9ACTN|nr:FAD/NAD(P)-binding protein [Actinoplanes ianthinogenes]BCJ40072.1 hydroxyacylglutathione hydrolase [Actinoplanes ianthinogenes]GGR10081.1 hydroxyacylglutathione hydrolase [Actinoplanes ianthinogenes]
MSSVVEVLKPASRDTAADRTVAVIGGGATGALLTRALIRRTEKDVVLIAPDRDPGRGVAYGAARPWHILNARAGSMSICPDDPMHLVRWSRDRGAAVEGTDFLPRADYGDYLAAQFSDTVAVSAGRLRHHVATATGLYAGDDGYVIRTDSGSVRAGQVILAVGNPRAARLPGISEAAYASPYLITDPWAGFSAPGSRTGFPHLDADEPVLLLGTGLTAVDVALTLAEAGHRGPIEAISRRGLLPLAHPQLPPSSAHPDLILNSDLTLRQLLRRVRAAIAGGADWVAVVDTLRHQADRLWAGFSDGDRERFLRHVVRYWDVHRHRMAPPVAARIAELQERGTLRFSAGRLRSVEPDPRGGLLVAIDGRPERRYAAVICCTGPGSLPGSADPFLSSLFRDGLVQPGPYGLGVDSDPDGHIRNGLWLAGPLRRGHLWEATAVPEIRAQVDRLVTALAQQYHR